MKRKYMFVLILLLILSLGGAVVAANSDLKKRTEEPLTEEQFQIVTSFYPMYIAALNVVKDVPGVTVVNMAGPQAGCLHDYQLTPENLITLSSADVFVVNGGGIESFLDDVLNKYPDLEILTASEGIELLVSEFGHTHHDEAAHDHDEAAHDHEEEDHGHIHEDEHLDVIDSHAGHNHGEYNAHVWMDIQNYIQEVENITAGLIARDPQHQEQYLQNKGNYIIKIEQLKDQADEVMSQLKGEKVIVFHDAFMYFAKAYEMEVEYVIDMDETTSLSAGQIAEIVQIMHDEEIQILFAEEQYGTGIADTIGVETGARTYILDSLVTGDGSLDSYLQGMQYNLTVLEEALGR